MMTMNRLHERVAKAARRYHTAVIRRDKALARIQLDLPEDDAAKRRAKYEKRVAQAAVRWAELTSALSDWAAEEKLRETRSKAGKCVRCGGPDIPTCICYAR